MSKLSWVNEFEKKYGHDSLLQEIKSHRMHGSVQINFCNGSPVNYNITIHRRASLVASNVATSSNSEQGADNAK